MNNLEEILFGTHKSRVVLLIAFFYSLVLIFLNKYFNFTYFFIHIFLINTLVAFTLITNRLGVIPSARYLFIVAPGFLQSLFWFFSDGNVRVAFLANDYINEDIVRQVSLISTIGGVSAMLGFIVKPIRFKIFVPSISITKFHTQFIFFLFLAFAFWHAKTLGASMLSSGGYGGDTEESIKAPIGAINVFYFLFFSIFFIYRLFQKKSNQLTKIAYYLIALIIVLYIALRGVRQDSLGFMLAVITILYASRLNFEKRAQYRIVFGLFIFCWLGSIITGTIRSEFNAAYLVQILSNPIGLFFFIKDNYLVVNLDTASMTIGTLNVIPYKINEGGFLLGKTFFDWLPRTFPEFLFPNRPEDPSYLMQYEGQWFGWGGIHEIAEEYWNFGFLGVIIMPFLFSYLINSLGKSFIRSSSFFTAIPIVWLIMMPRWSWYQIFALYKSTIVMVIIIYILYSIIIFYSSGGVKMIAFKRK